MHICGLFIFLYVYLFGCYSYVRDCVLCKLAQNNSNVVAVVGLDTSMLSACYLQLDCVREVSLIVADIFVQGSEHFCAFIPCTKLFGYQALRYHTLICLQLLSITLLTLC